LGSPRATRRAVLPAVVIAAQGLVMVAAVGAAAAVA